MGTDILLAPAIRAALTPTDGNGAAACRPATGDATSLQTSRPPPHFILRDSGKGDGRLLDPGCPPPNPTGVSLTRGRNRAGERGWNRFGGGSDVHSGPDGCVHGSFRGWILDGATILARPIRGSNRVVHRLLANPNLQNQAPAAGSSKARLESTGGDSSTFAK